MKNKKSLTEKAALPVRQYKKTKIRMAIDLLKRNGYAIKTLFNPNTLFLIRYLEKGVLKYSYRKCRKNNRNTSWPNGAEITKVRVDKLTWEKL